MATEEQKKAAKTIEDLEKVCDCPCPCHTGDMLFIGEVSPCEECSGLVNHLCDYVFDDKGQLRPEWV